MALTLAAAALIGSLLTAGAGIAGNAIASHNANAQASSAADLAFQRDKEMYAQQLADNRLLMQEQNAFNAAEAQKQRDWQEQMSATQYQRAMDDMQAAGLNPILAYQQGGATVSGGASASSASQSASSNSMGSNAAQVGASRYSAALGIAQSWSSLAGSLINGVTNAALLSSFGKNLGPAEGSMIWRLANGGK